MSDERMARKSSAENRENRAMLDRTVTESRELTDADRLQMFRQQMFQSALPDLPKLPGWHLCWLTTTNPYDPIQGRIRIGYEPVKPEDIPGWEHATLKSGEWAGFVGVNEMLAFKLPQSLYEAYMREAHHDAPLREEEKLADTVRYITEEAQRAKADVDYGDGMEDIVDKKRSRSARFEVT